MKRSNVAVLAAAIALLGAGIGGAVSHGSATRSARRTASAPAATATTSTGAPVAPAPGSSQLGAGLITPADMGGYYHVSAAPAPALLDSSGCLAPLQPTPAQAGRAETALLGPDQFSVPTIVEVVTSYAGDAPLGVYRSLVAALGDCRTLSFSFAGSRVMAPLSAVSLAAVGDADGAWAGSFSYSGRSLQIELGLALDGQEVVALAFINSVPPADPVMGDFPSTLSLAIGKLA